MLEDAERTTNINSGNEPLNKVNYSCSSMATLLSKDTAGCCWQASMGNSGGREGKRERGKNGPGE